jgi:coenzyme F420-dependent glucose-6-phosphate dehydrogenase
LNEVPATAMAWPPFKERFGRLREAVQLMQRLAREERVTFEGDYYRTDKATIYDRPEVPVPIYVAASGAVAARLAGRLGDGFICTSGKARELYTETLLPAVAEGLDKAGRAPGSIEYMIEMKVSFDTDRDRALHDTRHWAALALSSEDKMGVEDPIEMENSSALQAAVAAGRSVAVANGRNIRRYSPGVSPVQRLNSLRKKAGFS